MATTKIQTLFPTPSAYAAADTVNHEGFPAFSTSLPELVLRLLTTGTFENTFYASAQELAGQSLDVFRLMAGEDAGLFARMLVYARNEGLLRTVPITALVVLSTADTDAFKVAFPHVIRTPNDLRDFVQLCRQKSLRTGMGRAVKTAVNEWLGNLSEYHAIKYGSGGQALSLRDILRLTRPHPGTSTRQQALWHYLVRGELLSAEVLPQVAAFEALKRAVSTEERIRLIDAGRLPYEVVVGAVKPDVDLWRALLRQMPQFALLRHLNTLTKAGVFADRESLEHAVAQLTDGERVRRSKILPFRYYTAYQTLTPEVPRALTEAVETALELSLANMPRLPGRVCISPDVSGSMGSLVSDRGKTRFIDIAAIFAAAALRQSHESLVLPFNHDVVACRVSGRDTLMTTARTMASLLGGGTAVGAPARWLAERRERIDTFVGITDSEDWCYGWDGRDVRQFVLAPALRGTGQGFLHFWREYRRTVNPEAQAFLIQVAPYATRMAPAEEPGVYYISGWSDAVLPYIARTAQGIGSQMDAVRAVSFSRAPKEGTETAEEE